jgi:hypothetical protein
VVLRNLAAPESSRGPILIDRKDQQRRETVSANVAGHDLGSVVVLSIVALFVHRLCFLFADQLFLDIIRQ